MYLHTTETDQFCANTYDTIVIGLGSAGTTAASTLARAGRRVLALEAQDRVGGRVYSVPFGDGIVELGAEWIHGTVGSRVYELAVESNITTLPQYFKAELYASDGRDVNSTLLFELISYAYKIRKQPPSEAIPLGQFITDRVLEYLKETHPSVASDGEFLNQYLHFMETLVNPYEGTTSWYEITTDRRFKELDGYYYTSWNKFGYRTFIHILLNIYNNGPGLPTLDIKLNTEVTAVSWSQDLTRGVTVTTKDGTTYTADNVIVTVSLGVLKERYETLFSPQLSEAKKTAIEKLSMGVVGKVILLYKEQWWPSTSIGLIWSRDDERKLSDDDRWLYNVTNVSQSMGNPHALVFWSSGNTARLVETLSDEVVKRKYHELLQRFIAPHINRTVPEPIAMLRTHWASNPFTRGTYSYDNLLTPQYPTARSDLAEPLTDSSGNPRVLFAGEATNPTHYSTVHGASETGYREAARLLENKQSI
ncbi:spermine oxidase-like [Achroia grisella]|uniref:spermine oxidase-like n=1 Tax=Achroia grisella TaxID=688607 RepID=UPI0027D23E86|nr:spermine oxidase-like [Achroia grisella]